MNFDSNAAAFLPESGSGLTSRTTFFVDAGAGSDMNDGSFANPFQTIGYAIKQSAHVVGRNVINVQPGVYNENLNINDYGGLKIRGLGENPYDVIVNGNNEGNSLTIDGAGWVGIENMMFANGTQGIYASEVDQLQLYRVVSRNNSDYGLHADEIRDLRIALSSFLENERSGAAIILTHDLDISRSIFNRNFVNGLNLEENDSVKLRRVRANGNGMMDEDDDGPAIEAFSSMGHGVAAIDNEYLMMRGGLFSNNLANGVELVGNENATLYSVHASNNQRHGIGGSDNDNVMIFDGLLNENGGSGAWIYGFGSEEFARTAAAAETEFEYPHAISVNGTRLWDNGDEGLTFNNFYQVNLRNLNVRRNEYDGVDVSNAYKVWMRAINTMSNGDDGIDIDYSKYVTAIDNFAVANEEDGFDVDQSYRVDVTRGVYSGNERQGMNFNGDYDRYLQQVNIHNAVARDNRDHGLSLDSVNYANVIGGYYANNDNGIDLYNVGAFDAQSVGSRFNRQNGFYSDTGVAPPDDDDDNDDNGDVLRRGSINIRQSSFSDNQLNGIQISSVGYIHDYPQNGEAAHHEGGSAFDFDLDFDRVVASRNQGSGFYFGSNEDQPRDVAAAAYYEGSPNIYFDVNFKHGLYNQNGEDGIRAEGQQSFIRRQLVDAKFYFDRTRASNNDRYGVYVNNPDPSVNLRTQFYLGWFNRNAMDGVSVSTVQTSHRPFVDTALSEDGHHESETIWAALHAEGVVALSNGRNGLNFHADRFTRFEEDHPQAAESADGYHAHELVNIIGGGFHTNAYSGINLSVATDEGNDGNAGSRIYVERVYAKRNGQDGLTVAGYMPYEYEGPSPLGIQLDMVRGVFNRNQRDGIQLMNIGFVNMDRTVGIGNKDDGFDGTNLGDVLGDWTFVANEDEDFVMS